MRRVTDPHPTVRRQVAASLGELPEATRREALLTVALSAGSDPVVADLIVTGLSGDEMSFLERVLASRGEAIEGVAPTVRALAKAVMTSGNPENVERVVTLAGQASRPRWQRLALLEGARRPSGGRVVKLQAKPVGLVAAAASADTALRARSAQVAESLTWPGKPVSTPAVRPLTAEESQRFAAGEKQYLSTCSGCHQTLGTGLPGVAKPLVGSSWVLGPPERVIRIVLHGKEGAMLMPPLGKSLSNDQIAAVLTYVRRAWGNGASPIDSAAVKEVRGATTGRDRPWTEAELERARR
jgi:mono/diheme cytochrome c family protein